MTKKIDPERQMGNVLQQMTDAAKRFDKGDSEAAIGMAINARAIFHDGSAASLLNQLYLKNVIYLLSTTTQYLPGKPGAYYGLLTLRGAEGDSQDELLPIVQVVPEFVNKWHSCNDWWNELVVNGDGYSLSRQDIVLMIANKAGGSNLDGETDPGYADMPYVPSSGWKYSGYEGESIFANQLAYRTMYQIVFEILKSFEYHNKIKSYTRKVETKLNAIYFHDKLYFASYECEKYAATAAALVDPRHDRIETREVCFDSLLFKDGSKNGRILAI